jgi:RNA polymerase sigma-70 factor, ECF subfamily
LPVQTETVLEQLRERILRFAASRIERAEAEDLAQETLIVLHTRYAHLSEPADLLPVAFQILRYKMAAHFRRGVRRGESRAVPATELALVSEEPGPEIEAQRAEMRERLLAALPKLGARCREIFRMKLEGSGFDEIRRHFGVESINTVYTWDLRCRKHLLELVGGLWERTA